ncbi:MAG: Branched-chain amino acid aminotransferase/4-amino-4-deoxychorismate lyase [Frankiales bacterium]|nr:Branched-chain amino acid aminotransferase/4-amino-4-deoxychorismate lyase [Frankiales bacterium]
MTETVLVVLGPEGPVLADPAAPLLRADDPGVLRGESVFETLRIAGGRPAFLDAHLSRLGRSGARLALEVPDVRGLVALGVASWPAPDGVLRIVVSRGGTTFALLSALPPPVLTVSAVVLPLGVPAALRAEAHWLLGGVKSTSYAVNMAALREAAAQGADDVVFASSDGEVLEGPTSTCAWVTDGVLVTPPALEVGVLPGTTMDVALGLHPGPAVVRRGTVAELRAADEMLLLSSVRGVVAVTSLDGAPKAAGPVGRALREAFEAALRA